MNKPQIKREVSISATYREHCMISFYATQDAISDFENFGSVIKSVKNHYIITVDARYDFDEVVKYIESYGDEK